MNRRVGTQNNESKTIGTLNDTFNDETIYGLLKKIDNFLHSKTKIYPELANSVQLTKASGSWAAYPTPTEIIPVNTVTNKFQIHGVDIDTLSDNAYYSIKLYEGLSGSETEIATISVSRTASHSQESSTQIFTDVLSANTRISAAISSNAAGTNTMRLKVLYHEYE